MGGNGRLMLGMLTVMVLLVGLWLACGSARLTVLNDAMTVAYPAVHAAGAMVAATAAFALAALTRRRGLRVTAAVVAVGALALAGERIGYRLRAESGALQLRQFGVTTRLPWREIVKLTIEPSGMLVVTADARHIEVDSGLGADEAAIINRTVARRVRESNAR
jgi:hypothetical protein